MQHTSFTANPLIQSVVHQSFAQGIRELGLPELPRETFVEGIRPALHKPESLFEDQPLTHDGLYQAVLKGRIIITEAVDGALLFYVRGQVGRNVMDVRLSFAGQSWRVDKVMSMYERRFQRWSRLSAIVFVVCIIVAGIIGYSIHTTAPASTPALAVANGTNTIQPATNSTTGATTNTTNSSATIATNNTTQNIVAKAPARPKTFTYTVQSGTSLHDLSVFLHKNNLIHEEAVKFDMVLKNDHIDRTIRPGSYTFKPGMSTGQIINVLKQRPH